MTDADKIAYVTAQTGESNTDTVSAFLSMAADIVLNRAYPFVSDEEREALTVPHRYDGHQCRIAVYFLNKRGAEGEKVHNENGINRSYENGDVPDSLLKGIVPFCGLPKG